MIQLKSPATGPTYFVTHDGHQGVRAPCGRTLAGLVRSGDPHVLHHPFHWRSLLSRPGGMGGVFAPAEGRRLVGGQGEGGGDRPVDAVARASSPSCSRASARKTSPASRRSTACRPTAAPGTAAAADSPAGGELRAACRGVLARRGAINFGDARRFTGPPLPRSAS